MISADTPAPSNENGHNHPRKRKDFAEKIEEKVLPSKKRKVRGALSSGDLVKGQEVVAVKTDEDALKFLEKISAETQGPWPSQLLDMSEEVLKAVGDTSALEDPNTLTFGESSSGMTSSPPPSHISLGLDGFEFFDFTSFSSPEDDSVSKAATPDLVQTPSTCPSSDSGSETDATVGLPAVDDTAKAVDPSTAEDVEDRPDYLRLGMFKEIGGQSSYYHVADWKWEGSMPEQTWAFT